MEWKTKIFSIDAFAPWVQSITYKGPFFDGTMPQVQAEEGQWHARFFPDVNLIVNDYDTIVTSLIKHVTTEVLFLICETLAIDEKPNRIIGNKKNPQRIWARNQEIVDARYVLAWIMVARFGLTQSEIARIIGFKPCTANHAINECNNVRELQVKIRLVLSKYPFLKPANCQLPTANCKLKAVNYGL